jgi:hypothetical protein
MKAIYAKLIIDGKICRKAIILESKFCEECGKEFQPLTQKSIYCSRGCGKKAEYKRHSDRAKTKSKEWYRENLEKVRERRKNKYWENPEYWKAKSREWSRNNKEKKKIRDSKYKDNLRHGNKRHKLIEKSGLICSVCGKNGDEFNIVAHHVTHNPQDHTQQILLCRSCHAKEHNFGLVPIHKLTL